MSPLLQNLVVIALVVACAAIMGWRAFKVLRGKKTGCGCDHCPVVKKPPTAQPPR